MGSKVNDLIISFENEITRLNFNLKIKNKKNTTIKRRKK